VVGVGGGGWEVCCWLSVVVVGCERVVEVFGWGVCGGGGGRRGVGGGPGGGGGEREGGGGGGGGGFSIRSKTVRTQEYGCVGREGDGTKPTQRRRPESNGHVMWQCHQARTYPNELDNGCGY